MKIDIQSIPQSEMRVPGWGDWYWEGGTLHIRVVGDDPECNPFLVALHETVEAWLCELHGVSQEAVDEFDAMYETERIDEDGTIIHEEEEEAGDDPRAPYRKEHRAAMLVEHLMAHLMGLDDYGTMR